MDMVWATMARDPLTLSLKLSHTTMEVLATAMAMVWATMARDPLTLSLKLSPTTMAVLATATVWATMARDLLTLKLSLTTMVVLADTDLAMVMATMVNSQTLKWTVKQYQFTKFSR